MQAADHPTELLDLAAGVAARGVAVVWREVPNRLIAPVVAQSSRRERRVVDELVDGEQLDGGHTEPFEVLDRGRVREAGVCAPQLLGYVGVELGEALDVDLVEDRIGHRERRRSVLAPVELAGDHHRARNVRRRVGAVGAIGIVWHVAEHRRMPSDLAGDGARIRVEQQLRRMQRPPDGGSTARGPSKP